MAQLVGALVCKPVGWCRVRVRIRSRSYNRNIKIRVGVNCHLSTYIYIYIYIYIVLASILCPTRVTSAESTLVGEGGRAIVPLEGKRGERVLEMPEEP